ncbi:hypothetical protein JR316_0001276 [Psilocybe cubensis]|uniref:Uncharacterized protein n=2 Tax=Psilocybe cubensis TaxID=181762 RepID=A0ACB8HHQ6_PSICU|nr:hypothetical protein JR316_0001276 [Psilocybe cubensis]KAH9487207.1 hypothetical protein JR316_0001276 [Psilocybe cubensis]
MSSSPSPSTSKLTQDNVEEEVSEVTDKENTPLSDQKHSSSDSEEQEEESKDGVDESAVSGTTERSTTITPAPTSHTDASQWQAVWSPQYNAYYFFNATTQQTTWTNPLVPEGTSHDAQQEPASATGEKKKEDEEEPESSSSAGQTQLSAVAAQNAAIEAAALAQGIDPVLARLDPSLVASAMAPGQTVPGSLPTFTAQFNARTGRFAAVSSSSSSFLPSSSGPVRTPAHLSEYERAKRMSSFYFDVDKWEEDLAKRGGRLMGEEGEGAEEEGGKKRKRPSKKDIERYKEQKKQKKIAKTAWLRT